MAILKYSVKFNLQHNSNKNKDTAIRCIVRFNNERVIFGTNLRINPRFWNIKTQEPKLTNSFDGSEILDGLNNIKEFVKNEFDKLESYPEPDHLKQLCLEFMGVKVEEKEEKVGHLYFIAYMDDLVSEMDSGGKRISRGKSLGQKFSDNTVRGYQTVLSVFKSFAEFQKKTDYKFEEINKRFYSDLQNYFYNERKLSSGYFATVVKTLKTVMSEAKHDKLHDNVEYESRHFVKPSYESDTIYLTVEQLSAINKVELIEPHLKLARDVFLIGCWTGLRFSDFSELTLEDMEGDYIRVLTEKTKERVSIPCHPVVKDVLKRNGDNFPSKISNQNLNEFIKIVALRAGLTKQVSFKKNVGGVDVYEDVEFCTLITTHTARRSFATNMFKIGIPTFVIMAITGHRTESAFFKYIRVSNEEKAQMMREMWEKLGIFK